MKKNRCGKATVIEEWEAEAIYNNFTKPNHQMIWQILRFTGERAGALLQLKIENVYFNPSRRIPSPEITFPAATRKASPNGQRKTRQIVVLDKLKSCLEKYPIPSDTDYLFPSPKDPHKPLLRTTFDASFRKSVKRAGLSNRGISLHSCRRTFITKLHDAGYSLAMIQEITGHKSLEALRGYVEVSPEAITNALKNLNL